jgi:hypothetical protein
MFGQRKEPFMKSLKSLLSPPLFLAATILALAPATELFAQSAPTLDPGFRPTITRLGGAISAIAVQPDGKLVSGRRL